MWGQVDFGVIYISNKCGGVLWGMVFGIGVLMCWGLCGNEVFGGGYCVVFVLESGFNVNMGMLIKFNMLFDWQVYVGFDGLFGMIMFGCQVDLMDDVVICYLNVFWNCSLYVFYVGNLDSLINGYQIENVVKYWSLEWYGICVGVLYGFIGLDVIGYSVGVYVIYDCGLLLVGVMYMMIQCCVFDLYNYFGWIWFFDQMLFV